MFWSKTVNIHKYNQTRSSLGSSIDFKSVTGWWWGESSEQNDVHVIVDWYQNNNNKK